MVKLVQHDLEFILKQIKIAEAHAAGGNLAELVGEAGEASGAAGTGAPQPHLLPYGLRTVDGSYNNLIDGQEHWAAADQPFTPLVTPNHINEGDDSFAYVPGNNNDYGAPGSVVDVDPRLISNLIVDQTSNNPAATALYDAMLAEGKNATRTQLLDLDDQPVWKVPPVLDDTGAVVTPGEEVWLYTFENVSPDIGDSAPYSSIFTLFGQFFDHGLDLIAKGGNGTVYIPLQADDPLYNPNSPQTNFMVMTRVSPNAVNTTTPWVDQNQTYTSHASHQVFLREYVMLDGKPVSTGSLLDGDRGLATWGDVKEQARTMLGIELTDADVGNVPLLRTDPYGNFIPDPVTGFAQVIIGLGTDGIPNTADDLVASGTPTDPITTAGAVRTAHAFLDDIAHSAVPSAPVDHDRNPDTPAVAVTADEDDIAGNLITPNNFGVSVTYDDELLDAHYITGDGRGNENVGLTSIHHVFHSEHNNLVEQTKQVVLDSGDRAFINEWLLVDLGPNDPIPTNPANLVWDGERLFQAARFTNEMEYQHLVFEEFGRKMQPDIDAFVFEPSSDINPAIFTEFAQAVYRFGHSMLNENIDRLVEGPSTDPDNPNYVFDNLSLFDGFLNPLALGAVDAEGNVIVDHDAAAGAVIRGMSRQGANEIDEFVTNVLRNQLVGIPLDLAAINIARGRDVGLPTLNEARAKFFAMTGQDSQLRPYTSWVDFALNISNPASIINFIAAYGSHDTIVDATTLEGKRAAAALLVLGGVGEPADRLDFLNATGEYAGGTLGGLNTIDLWMGGLAEKKMDFGSMLGSTFSFVFELQMENLQDGDRFYYLSRVQGLNLLNELENNTLTEIIMRNTDLGEDGRTALPGDIFSTPDYILEMDQSKQVGDDPTFDNAILQALTPLVVRLDTDGDLDPDVLIYNGGDHVVVGGTDEDDTIIVGEGDDTVWGYDGDDTIEGGYGVDKIYGGEGDDIITNAGTDIGAADFLHGNEGNDVIQGGNGLGLIFGNEGQDFLVAGPDGKHVLGGLGNDFIRGGDGVDFLMGNEGDDWIEGGGRFDTLAGENSELFFNSTIIGHDVLDGGSNDTDYDAESGDDIMFQNAGIQRSNGMAGFDWAIHKGDNDAADSDLGIPAFATQEAFILRDRFDLVEGLSGWVHDDVLTGRVSPTNARAELQNTAAIPGEGGILDSYSNALLEKNVDLIDGLRPLVAHLARTSVTVAGKTEQIVLDTADASDILLGGGGSDIIKGMAGNDIIDGDKWLNVRISINDAEGDEIGTADGMTGKVYDADGEELYGGRTLDALMFDRTLNPGQLEIAREILDGDLDDTATDIAVYTDIRENYTITSNADGSITVSHTGFDEDAVNPDDEETVQRPLSDATDRLFNIEVLRFSDGDVVLSRPQLALDGPNTSTFADGFNSANWGNSNGSVNWGPDWIESNDSGVVIAGQIRLDAGGNGNNVLQFVGGNTSNGAEITRVVDLVGRTSATIRYSANPDNLDAGEHVLVEFAADGVNFVTLQTIDGTGGEVDYAHVVTGPFTSTARIRFTATSMNTTNEVVSIDDLSIEFPTSPAVVNYETTFIEDDDEVDIADGALIVDAGGEIVSARIVLTNAQAGDEFDFPGNLPGGIDSDVDVSVPGQIIVTLTGAESLAEYQDAINSITFNNTSDAPSTVDRIIQVTVNNGLMDSNVAVATVNVIAVDDDVNAVNDSIITNISGTTSIVIPKWALLLNDTDPDSPISITSVSNASNLSNLANGASSISFTDPATGQGQTAGGSFTYTATGAPGDTDPATVTVIRDATGAIEGTTTNNGNNILVGSDTANSFDAGTGNDIVLAGGGDDTIAWNANNASANSLNGSDGRDIIDGGAGTDDHFVVTGNNNSELYRIYTRADALAAGIALLHIDSEIIITRGTANLVIAELDNIEEITINTAGGGGDNIEVIGDFTGTSLNLNTITIEGAEGDDTIDISALASAHRIVFRSNGGNDTIVGTLRPQDVVELPDGASSGDYDITTDDDGVTTMANEEHSIRFVSPNGLPQFNNHHDDDDEDEDDEEDDDDHPHDQNDDDDDDDDHHDDDDGGDNCGCDDDDEDEGTSPPPLSGGSILGTALGDMLTGTVGADLIFGLAGTDYIVAGGAADVIRADEGEDFISGDAGRDVIFAGDNDDTVFGGDDADMIYGEDGDDRIFGDDGGDLIDAGLGSDTVFGGLGDDLLIAHIGDGNDTYDGGAGIDTLDLGSLTAAVTVDLGTGVGGRGNIIGSQSGTDALYSVENITTGSGSDRITTSNAVNIIDGGEGNDVFVFGSGAAANGDTILGFEAGDKIDLSGIDANSGAAGSQSFTLVTSQAATAPAQITVTHETREDGDYTVVSGHTNGDNQADFRIDIAGSHQLINADFNL